MRWRWQVARVLVSTIFLGNKTAAEGAERHTSILLFSLLIHGAFSSYRNIAAAKAKVLCHFSITKGLIHYTVILKPLHCRGMLLGFNMK